MSIKQNDWKNKPLTEKAVKINLDLSFDKVEIEKIIAGHKPSDQDDRWFIYFENDWIYFHRSLTGHCIFKIKIELAENIFKTSEFWVERDKAIYHGEDDGDRQLVEQVIRGKLLI